MQNLFIDESKIRLTKELGEGSYGKVWAGDCLQTPVAVKVLGDAKVSELSEKQFSELENEVKIMTYVALNPAVNGTYSNVLIRFCHPQRELT